MKVAWRKTITSLAFNNECCCQNPEAQSQEGTIPTHLLSCSKKRASDESSHFTLDKLIDDIDLDVEQQRLYESGTERITGGGFATKNKMVVEAPPLAAASWRAPPASTGNNPDPGITPTILLLLLVCGGSFGRALREEEEEREEK